MQKIPRCRDVQQTVHNLKIDRHLLMENQDEDQI